VTVTRDDDLILYDDDCEFCRGAVDFIRHRDRSGRWRFQPLEASQVTADNPTTLDTETLHLFDPDGHHDRSTAILRIAADLPWPWSWLRFLRVLPRSWRDAAYDLIARNRDRWPLSRRRGRR
jgi:predicted DCC family thiol-disulfide oxidoreductase YuxK